MGLLVLAGCGPAEKYSSTLSRLASWGFMVIASQQQGDCGVINVDHPFATLGNLFQLPVKFSNAVDFSGMADDIRSNLRYLKSRPYVDIPTMEYAVALLNQSLDLDAKSGQSFLDESASDSRIVDIRRSR